MAIAELLGFVAISFVIAITPGPSVVYVVSYSLRYGAKAGVVSTLGINVGSIVFILMAGFGLSAVLKVYPEALTVVQLVGSLYIIYLAIKMWPRGVPVTTGDFSMDRESYKSLFFKGVITSVLNPKDILFYTAFIPTFIPQEDASKTYQSWFMILAFSYMAIGFLTKCTFAVFSGYSKSALQSKYANLVNYVSAIALIVLGLFLLRNTSIQLSS